MLFLLHKKRIIAVFLIVAMTLTQMPPLTSIFAMENAIEEQTENKSTDNYYEELINENSEETEEKLEENDSEEGFINENSEEEPENSYNLEGENSSENNDDTKNINENEVNSENEENESNETNELIESVGPEELDEFEETIDPNAPISTEEDENIEETYEEEPEEDLIFDENIEISETNESVEDLENINNINNTNSENNNVSPEEIEPEEVFEDNELSTSSEIPEENNEENEVFENNIIGYAAEAEDDEIISTNSETEENAFGEENQETAPIEETVSAEEIGGGVFTAESTLSEAESINSEENIPIFESISTESSLFSSNEENITASTYSDIAFQNEEYLNVSTYSDADTNIAVSTDSDTDLLGLDANISTNSDTDLLFNNEIASTSLLALMNLSSTPSILGVGPDHYHGSDNYRAISNESDLYNNTSSFVYLINDVLFNDAVNLSSFDNNKLLICLNGKTLSFANGKTIFNITNGQSLEITNCSIDKANFHFTEISYGSEPLLKTTGTSSAKIENINMYEISTESTLDSLFEASNGGTIIFNNILFDGNTFETSAFYSHGENSKIIFSGENLIQNSSSINHSLLRADNHGTIEIQDGNTKIFNLYSTLGGVALLENYSKFIVNGTLIATGNNAEKGGFAYIDNTVSFESSSGHINIEDCFAEYGGGLYINVINENEFTNISFNIKNCQASAAGGGIYLYLNNDIDIISGPSNQITFTKNTAPNGSALYIDGQEGKFAQIENLNFKNHTLVTNQSLIYVNASSHLDNLNIQEINKDPDDLGQLVSNGALIKVNANNNNVTISNLFLDNNDDKLNRAYQGIKLVKDVDKKIDLTISTYSISDKIAFGVDFSEVQDDGYSKINLNNIYTNYTTNCEEFNVPLAENFPRPENFYTALSSLTGNGSKALSLDYVPNFNTRWDIRYRFDSYGKSIGAMPYWYGGGYSGGYNVTGSFGFISKNDKFLLCVLGQSTKNRWTAVNPTTVRNLYIDAYNKKASNGGDTLTTSKPRGMDFNNPGSFKYGVSKLFIFGASNSGNGARNVHAGTVYSSKIYESGVLIRNFIPIQLTKDIPKSMDHYGISRKAGSTGLWDTINEEFYEYIGGLATSRTTETGIYAFDSSIPVTINNLSIQSSPKKSFYVEDSKNITFNNTNIINANAASAMIEPFIKIVGSTDVTFDGNTNITNNTTSKNSIISVIDNSAVTIKGNVSFVNNTCSSTEDKKSSVLYLDESELYIKTEDIDFSNNKTKKGVFGLYNSAKLYVSGYFYVKDNYTYGDTSKTLNIYLNNNSFITYDTNSENPIKSSSKIAITTANLESTVFQYWNKSIIEDYNLGSDLTKDIFTPDNIFMPDTAHQNNNQLIYKKDVAPNVNLCLGVNFAKLIYKNNTVEIASQLVAKNIETTIDCIYLKDTLLEHQNWQGPSLANENIYEFWGVTGENKKVKISANKEIKNEKHTHMLCGDVEGASCEHDDNRIVKDYIFVDNATTLAQRMSAYKNVFLSNDIILNNQIALSENTTYAICLNGHSLSFANGKNIFNLTNNKKLAICNCKSEGHISINPTSNSGSSPIISLNNGSLSLIKTNIASISGSKSSLISANGEDSTLFFDNIKVLDNKIRDKYLVELNNINKASFSNINIKNNNFENSGALFATNNSNIFINNIDISENNINSLLINRNNTNINYLSDDNIKLYNNTSFGSIINSSGNAKAIGIKHDNFAANSIYNIINGEFNINNNLNYHNNKGINGALFNIKNGAILNINTDISNFTNNESNYGSLFYSNGTINVKENIVLSQNKAHYEGTFIYVDSKGTLFVESSKNLTLDNPIFSTYSLASALYTSSPNIKIDGDLIIKNCQRAIHTKNVTNYLNLKNTTCENNKQGIFFENSFVTINNSSFVSNGQTEVNGGAFYISKGNIRLNENILIDNNINAIYNEDGSFYFKNPDIPTLAANIEIKNNTGSYVLSASKVSGASYYLLGGKVHDNSTDYIYTASSSSASSNIKNITFFVGGNFVTEVASGKKGIHVTDYPHEIFNEFSSLKMTNDVRLSYYVDNNGTRIFSNFNNPSINKDTVFIIEDPNRDPERPMYLDQYEDTRDIYIYYKSVVIQYKYIIEKDNNVYNLDMQKNQHLPRRVIYNSSDPVAIGTPWADWCDFKGWQGPDIATPNYMGEIILKNLTDMTPRTYTAYFAAPPKSRGGVGGGGSNGNMVNYTPMGPGIITESPEIPSAAPVVKDTQVKSELSLPRNDSYEKNNNKKEEFIEEDSFKKGLIIPLDPEITDPSNKNWKKIVKSIEDGVETVNEFLEQTKQNIEKTRQLLLSFGQGLVQAFVQVFENTKSFLANNLPDSLQELVYNFVDGLGKQLKKIGDNIVSSTKKTAKLIQNYLLYVQFMQHVNKQK